MLKGVISIKFCSVIREMLRIYKKKTLRVNSAGEKRFENVLLFSIKPKNMDIFFFIYNIIYGLPRGVLEVPRGGGTDGVRSW